MRYIKTFESQIWKNWWEEASGLPVDITEELCNQIGQDELEILSVHYYPGGVWDGKNHFDSFEINLGITGHFGMGTQKNYITQDRFPIEQYRKWLKSFFDKYNLDLDHFYHTSPPKPGIRICFSRKQPVK